MQKLREEIISLVSDKNEKITHGALRRKLGITTGLEKEFTKTIDELKLEGKIYNIGNSYMALPSNFFVTKVFISGNEQFVKINNKISFIRANNVLNGDTVIVKKNEKNNYEVMQILKRYSNVVGEVSLVKGVKIVKFFNVNRNINIKIREKELNKLVDGDRFTANVETEPFEDIYYAKVDSVIGNIYKLNLKNLNYKTVLESYGFKSEFSSEALKETEIIANLKIEEKDILDRIDLRDKTVFTIDCKGCMDMDDSVGIWLNEKNNIVMATNIAHVSNYVKLGSALFNDAKINTTSVYFPGFVNPMLPTVISNGVCSLNPGEDKLTRSTIAQYNLNGDLVDVSTPKTIINSRIKMNYPKLNEYYEKGIMPDEYMPYKKDLDLLLEFAQKLAIKRKNRGCLDFENNELEFELDNNGKAISVNTRKPGTAGKLIESLMIESNELAYSNLSSVLQKVLPKRNHEAPSKNDYKKLLETLKLIGIELKHVNVDNPYLIMDIINRYENDDNFIVICKFILMSLCQAYYHPDNIGHFGLGIKNSKMYGMTTSPIRRIVDLLYQIGKDLDENDLLKGEVLSDFKKLCLDISVDASIKERMADKASQIIDKMNYIDIMKNNIGQEMELCIQDIKSSYIIVTGRNNLEGICYYDDFINEDSMVFNPNKRNAKGRNNTYKIGQTVLVKVKEISSFNLCVYYEVLDNLSVKKESELAFGRKKKIRA